MLKRQRQHNEKHLEFIRGLPCLVCKDNTSTEAAHVRFTYLQAGKVQAGIGRKPDDWWTVPLCGRCHKTQHDVGELHFWRCREMPIIAALALWAHTGNHEVGEQIVRAAHD